MPNHETLFLYSTAPSKEVAHTLAETLISEHLVAGVTILPNAESIYHWQGKIERHEEYILLMHSTKAQWPYIQEALQTIHPYTTPCLIAIPITAGLQDFTTWIHESIITPSHPLENA